MNIDGLAKGMNLRIKRRQILFIYSFTYIAWNGIIVGMGEKTSQKKHIHDWALHNTSGLVVA